MTYAIERDKVGRKSFTRFEVDFPTCALTYGIAPCTASGGSGNECRNTNNTCQDLANYDGSTTKTIEFCDVNISIPGYPMHPLLESVNLSPTKIVKDSALGKRAQITVSMRNDTSLNFVDDADIDPYWANRTGTVQGTFLGKLKAIFKYYNGAAARVKTTYIADPYDPTDSETRNYILEEITGPSKGGNYTFTVMDVLKLADNLRAKWPIVTTGILAADMTIGSTASFTITDGAGQYTDGGAYIRIGDEVIQYTSGSDSGADYVIAGTITRGAYGENDAATHKSGDTVQLCYELNDTNLVDFLETLLFTAAGISSGYKDSGWAIEQSTWFGSTLLNGLLTKAEGVKSIIEDLQQNHAMFYLWWDEKTQKIKFKAVSPATSVTTTFNDSEHNLEFHGISDSPNERLTRAYVLYAPHDPVKTDKVEYYRSAYVKVDADAEGTDQHGDIRDMVARSRFFTSESLAVQFGSRKVARFIDPPKTIKLKLDAKDTDTWTGDLVNLSIRQNEDIDGSAISLLAQVFSVKELTSKAPGTHYEYEFVDTGFDGRYGRIMSAAASSVYSSATDTEKAEGFYIASSGGADFSDGGGAYKIV